MADAAYVPNAYFGLAAVLGGAVLLLLYFAHSRGITNSASSQHSSAAYEEALDRERRRFRTELAAKLQVQHSQYQAIVAQLSSSTVLKKKKKKEVKKRSRPRHVHQAFRVHSVRFGSFRSFVRSEQEVPHLKFTITQCETSVRVVEAISMNLM